MPDMTEEKSKRGGARPGAGRPRSPDKKDDRLVVLIEPEEGQAYRELCAAEGTTYGEDLRGFIKRRLRRAK